MDDFKEGDTVFYTYTKTFGKILDKKLHTGVILFTEVLVCPYDSNFVLLTKRRIWSKNNCIKLNPDTPENRLFMQLKYGQ